MFGLISISGRPDEKSFSLAQTKFSRKFNPCEASAADIVPLMTTLKNGDLLRVFNSIAEGREVFTIEIDLENSNISQQYQKNTDPAVWKNLFLQALPARLIKGNGQVHEGSLKAFHEQGMESIAWCLYDFQKKGYDSLHSLEKGDLLTVFSHVLNGHIEWQGRLQLIDKPDKTGRKILLAGRNEDGGLYSGEVEEEYIKTAIHPERIILENFSTYNLPAQVVR